MSLILVDWICIKLHLLWKSQNKDKDIFIYLEFCLFNYNQKKKKNNITQVLTEMG